MKALVLKYLRPFGSPVNWLLVVNKLLLAFTHGLVQSRSNLLVYRIYANVVLVSVLFNGKPVVQLLHCFCF